MSFWSIAKNVTSKPEFSSGGLEIWFAPRRFGSTGRIVFVFENCHLSWLRRLFRISRHKNILLRLCNHCWRKSVSKLHIYWPLCPLWPAWLGSITISNYSWFWSWRSNLTFCNYPEGQWDVIWGIFHFVMRQQTVGREFRRDRDYIDMQLKPSARWETETL